jgi:hypothetical protein
VTTFDEVRRLAAEVAIARRAGRDATGGELRLRFSDEADECREQAMRLLLGQPIEVFSAVYGPGVLEGVDHRDGRAVIFPAALPNTMTVPFRDLREPA